MNAFQSGMWRFRAGIEPSPKQWEVVYHYREGNRQARRLFHTEEEAQRFADATGGKVRKIELRGGFR